MPDTATAPYSSASYLSGVALGVFPPIPKMTDVVGKMLARPAANNSGSGGGAPTSNSSTDDGSDDSDGSTGDGSTDTADAEEPDESTGGSTPDTDTLTRRVMGALGGHESDNDYSAVNHSKMRKGANRPRAKGKYQFMPNTLSRVSKQMVSAGVLDHAPTMDQFRADPALQEQVMYFFTKQNLEKNLDKYGDVNQALKWTFIDHYGHNNGHYDSPPPDFPLDPSPNAYAAILLKKMQKQGDLPDAVSDSTVAGPGNAQLNALAEQYASPTVAQLVERYSPTNVLARMALSGGQSTDPSEQGAGAQPASLTPLVHNPSESERLAAAEHETNEYLVAQDKKNAATKLRNVALGVSTPDNPVSTSGYVSAGIHLNPVKPEQPTEADTVAASDAESDRMAAVRNSPQRSLKGEDDDAKEYEETETRKANMLATAMGDLTSPTTAPMGAVELAASKSEPARVATTILGAGLNPFGLSSSFVPGFKEKQALFQPTSTVGKLTADVGGGLLKFGEETAITGGLGEFLAGGAEAIDAANAATGVEAADALSLTGTPGLAKALTLKALAVPFQGAAQFGTTTALSQIAPMVSGDESLKEGMVNSIVGYALGASFPAIKANVAGKVAAGEITNLGARVQSGLAMASVNALAPIVTNPILGRPVTAEDIATQAAMGFGFGFLEGAGHTAKENSTAENAPTDTAGATSTGQSDNGTSATGGSVNEQSATSGGSEQGSAAGEPAAANDALGANGDGGAPVLSDSSQSAGPSESNSEPQSGDRPAGDQSQAQEPAVQPVQEIAPSTQAPSEEAPQPTFNATQTGNNIRSEVSERQGTSDSVRADGESGTGDTEGSGARAQDSSSDRGTNSGRAGAEEGVGDIGQAASFEPSTGGNIPGEPSEHKVGDYVDVYDGGEFLHSGRVTEVGAGNTYKVDGIKGLHAADNLRDASDLGDFLAGHSATESQETPQGKELTEKQRLAKIVAEGQPMSVREALLEHFAIGGKIHPDDFFETVGRNATIGDGSGFDYPKSVRKMHDTSALGLDQIVNEALIPRVFGDDAGYDATPDEQLTALQDARDTIDGVMDKDDATRQLADIYEARNQGAADPFAEEVPDAFKGILDEPDGSAQTGPAQTGPADDSLGIKNAISDREREANGLPPRAKAGNLDEHTFDALNEKAAQTMKDTPNAGKDLVYDISKRPRTISDGEDALLAHEVVRSSNELKDARDAVNSAMTDEDRVTAQQRLTDAQDAYYNAYEAADKAGTENGRALNARKMMLKQDYSLDNIERAYRAAKEGNVPVDQRKGLSPEDLAYVKKMHDRLQAAESKNIEYETDRVGKEVFSKMLQEAAQSVSKSIRRAKGNSILEKADNVIAEARAEMLKRKGQLNAAIIPGLQNIDLWTKIAAAHVAKLAVKGAVKFSDWADAMRTSAFDDADRDYIGKHLDELYKNGTAAAALFKTSKDHVADTAINPNEKLSQSLVFKLARAKINENPSAYQGIKGFERVMREVHSDLQAKMPELTERQVRDAYSGYGKTVFPSKDETLTKLREFRSLGQKVSAIEDAMKGEAPKRSGRQRDQPSQDVRDKIKELRDVMREKGIDPGNSPQSLKSALQATKTRLTNAIQDLERQVANRAKDERTRTPIALDAEGEALKARVNDLRAQLGEITGGPKLSPEELRTQQAVAGVQRSIANLDDKIAGVEKAKPAEVQTTPELENLRLQRAALTEQYKQMQREANPPKSDEQRRVDAATNALKKSIATYDDLIASGEKRAKVSKVQSTPEMDNLRVTREGLRLQYESLHKAATLSPEEQRLASYKKAIQKRTDSLQQKVDAGDFRKPVPTKTALDREAMGLQADYNRIKAEFDGGVAKMRLAARPWQIKALDKTVEGARAVVMTSPNVFKKLGVAAHLRALVLNPLEQGLGAATVKVTDQIAKVVPSKAAETLQSLHSHKTEFSAATELRGLASGYTRGFKDAKTHIGNPLKLKGGHTDIELRFGNPRELHAMDTKTSYQGFLHKAMKDPLVRSSFERNYDYISRDFESKGKDIHDPLQQDIIGHAAYSEAMRDIYMNDNHVTAAFSHFTTYLQNSKTNKLGPYEAAALELALPVRKIPSNLVFDAVHNYGYGSVAAPLRVMYAIARGAGALPPEQSAAIMRQFTKGIVGLGAAAALYGGYKALGGSYVPGEKRKPGDVQPGHMNLFGTDLGPEYSHTSLVMLAQAGATMARSAQEQIKGKYNQHTGSWEPEHAAGLWKGVEAGLLGLASDVPFIGFNKATASALSNEPGKLDAFVGDEIKARTVPVILQQAAKSFDDQKPGNSGNLLQRAFSPDPVDRYAVGIGARIAKGIPGLRNNLPLDRTAEARDEAINAAHGVSASEAAPAQATPSHPAIKQSSAALKAAAARSAQMRALGVKHR